MRTTRLRITLRDVEPVVVRVVDVPASALLSEVHDLLQVAIGWTDSHLHRFDTDQAQFGALDDDVEDYEPNLRDETTATLRDLGERFVYLYDYGDGWEHDVQILGPGLDEPGCVDGEGPCPPEDCGGAPGYEHFRGAWADVRQPDHEQMRSWASRWVDDFDQDAADRLVRDTVGQVPDSVRLVLDALAGGVKLTPGGRLPRAVVRAVQAQRPGWSPLDQPAHLEEDLPPLSRLHDLLRDAGLVRLSRGVLAPTKAASDDVDVVRRLRRALARDRFYDVLFGSAAGHLAALGPRTPQQLGNDVLPWLRRWAVDGRPVTAADLTSELDRSGALLRSLDLADLDWFRSDARWHPGPSAKSLLPRATALAHLLAPR